MNDRPGDEDSSVEPAFEEPAFDDPAFDELRSLLADARVTDPLPPEVAARLDATLAALQAGRDDSGQDDSGQDDSGQDDSGRDETAGTAGDGVVVPLRRRFAPLLAAAAAVIVVAAGGVGIAQVAHHGSTGSDSTAAGSANSASGVAPTSPEAVVPSTQPKALGEALGPLPRLSSAAFAQDAARVMRTLAASGQTQTNGFDTTPAPGSTSGLSGAGVPAPPVTTAPPDLRASAGAAAAACAGPAAPGAVTVPARLDGRAVALVFRPPSATAQQVEAWSCDGTTLLASASVPR